MLEKKRAPAISRNRTLGMRVYRAESHLAHGLNLFSSPDTQVPRTGHNLAEEFAVAALYGISEIGSGKLC